MNVLGIDVGATKLGWGTFDHAGKLIDSGHIPTPTEPEGFIEAVAGLITQAKPEAVGIGIPGTISLDHTATTLCTNLPGLSDLPIVHLLKERHPELPIAIDNDGRCALIGEVWQGNARDLANVVMVTVGTGVGGAVMQGGKVRPHPQDVEMEVGRVLVDPSDVFPAKGGQGTVEAFIGGHNVQERLQIDLAEIAEQVRQGDREAEEIWHAISYFFIQCMRAIQLEYSCDAIVIGGIGSKDFPYYLQDPTPCSVLPAKLLDKAGIYGAARLALDAYEAEAVTDKE